MWYDYNRDGMSDFMCTNAVTYIIRDHLVHANVQMRSNDCIFGYRNDRAWQLHVLKMLVDDLNGRRKSSHQAEVVKVTEENKYRQQQRQSISLGMSGGMSGGTILKIEDLPPPDPFIPYTVGNLYWNVTSLHVYARHLKLVDPNYQGTT
jgi:thymidylate synthase